MFRAFSVCGTFRINGIAYSKNNLADYQTHKMNCLKHVYCIMQMNSLLKQLLIIFFMYSIWKMIFFNLENMKNMVILAS